jgi:hypothetical protein
MQLSTKEIFQKMLETTIEAQSITFKKMTVDKCCHLTLKFTNHNKNQEQIQTHCVEMVHMNPINL